MSATITNAKYCKDELSDTNCSIRCIIDGRHCSVPMDLDNTDYQAILEWVAEGNTIQDAD